MYSLYAGHTSARWLLLKALHHNWVVWADGGEEKPQCYGLVISEAVWSFAAHPACAAAFTTGDFHAPIRMKVRSQGREALRAPQ